MTGQNVRATFGPGKPERDLLAILDRRRDVAASLIFALTRALWEGWESGDGWVKPDLSGLSGVQINKKAWAANSLKLLPQANEADKSLLKTVLAPAVNRLAGKQHSTSLFSAFHLGKILTEGRIPLAELHYHLLRDFRIHYHILPVGEQISKLYRLIDPYIRSDAQDVQLPLSLDASSHPDDKPLLRDFFAYFEVLRPERKLGWATFDPALFDLRTAPTRLFGLLTSIPGFDAMFGGSGLTLFDSITQQGSGNEPDATTPMGRIVLTKGPFGAGKSLLTLQFAIEVARKGGIVIIASMEQSMEECLLSLRAIGVCARSDRFEIRQDIWDSAELLLQQKDGKGAIIFLRLPKSYEGDPLEGFTDAVRKRLDLMGAYSLRLLVVDPINAAVSGNAEKQFDNRRLMHRLFEDAKAGQINLWLTSEDSASGRPSEPFPENIADTVLQLNTDAKGKFFRRTIEVKKSRLQREEPGRHSLMITAGEGIHIYLASSARSWSVRRSEPIERVAVDLGIKGLDQILPRQAVRKGDLIVFHGPPNSARTSAGLQFLHRGSARDHALFIADVDDAKAKSLLEESRLAQQEHMVHVCSIIPGWIEPGQILERVAKKFEEARYDGKPITRVLLTNLTQWGFSMPLIGDDAAFGRSLLNLLRNSGATCIITTSPSWSADVSALTELVLAEADCQLEFDVWEIGNKLHSVVRVLRSHEGRHRRDRFEIIVDGSGPRIEPGVAALHRKDPGGAIRSITVRSSLHADTVIQQRYDERVMGAIGTSLTGGMKIEEQITHYDPAIFSLHRSSAVDELQIIQLDEFQLPDPASPQAEGFHRLAFSPKGHSHPLSDRVSRLADRVLTRDSTGNVNGCIAVPYFDNLSLLAYRDGIQKYGKVPGSSDKNGWDQLQKICLEWQREHAEPAVFFSCPIAHPQSLETYNCLFFEILMCRHPLPENTGQLIEWLEPRPTKSAAHIFRDLCYRSYRHTYREALLNERARLQARVNGQPINDHLQEHHLTGREDAEMDFESAPYVWRHWFNTLNAFLSACRPEERNRITVQPLFGNNTTAGEWYLALPAYSATPETGWELIRLLTSYERELQRVYLGVGLPTRKAFYGLRDKHNRNAPEQQGVTLSPFFDLERSLVQRLVQKAFQRSKFPLYARFTETIAAHLKRILELPELPAAKSRADLYRQIDRIVENMIATLAFVQADAGATSAGVGRNADKVER